MPVNAREILGASGPIARAFGAAGAGAEYEPRPQQLEMAGAVEAALAGRGRLLVEAGTGVGKSLAYLVPAILRCISSGKPGSPGPGERIVVATNTIALQEQLIGKDIPLLAESLGDGSAWGLDPKAARPLRPVLVKGRGNYLSIRRLKLASQRQHRLLADAPSRQSLHVIEDWAAETLDGTLSTLPAIERPSVWDRVRSDSDNCMGRKCPHHAECFYQQARREMEAGNLLICNHAVFFADLAMRAAGLNGSSRAGDAGGAGASGAGFLPDYQHVILDEAHNVEDVASDHFGLGLTESRVEHFLGILYHGKTGRGYLSQLDALAAEAGAREPGAGLKSAVDAAAHATLRALDASRAFFDALLMLARRGDPSLLRGGRLIRSDVVENALSPALRVLAARLRALREQAPSEPDKYELNAYSIRADAIAFDADVLIAQSRDGYVYWLEAGQGEQATVGGKGPDEDADASLRGPELFRGRTRIKLACSPIEVGPALREHLWSRELGIVLCSATLAVKGAPARHGTASASADVEAPDEPADGPHDTMPGANPPRVDPAFVHLAERLGCDQARTLMLGSPFDYARQAEVIIDVSVPDARSADAAAREHYHDALAQRIAHHVRQTDGGAFVLFTSFATLRAVADRLGPVMDREGLPLLAQGRDGPAGRLVELFRADERSVLLGAASLWQGVDVRGRGLRNVIIVKLPFEPPDRPIVEARGERLRARGLSPFTHDALPRAILRFKQGFGRLIRARDDFGRVVIMDARVITTVYGRRFLEALPEGVEMSRAGEAAPRRGEGPRPGLAVPERHWQPLED
ncbi:MAG: ATP-dependent DNA helicase [Phycisphaerales bacterium]